MWTGNKTEIWTLLKHSIWCVYIKTSFNKYSSLDLQSFHNKKKQLSCENKLKNYNQVKTINNLDNYLWKNYWVAPSLFEIYDHIT